MKWSTITCFVSIGIICCDFVECRFLLDMSGMSVKASFTIKVDCSGKRLTDGLLEILSILKLIFV
jgi:hypothetical protein